MVLKLKRKVKINCRVTENENKLTIKGISLHYLYYNRDPEVAFNSAE